MRPNQTPKMVISLVAEADQYHAIKAAAAALGLSVSTFLRGLFESYEAAQKQQAAEEPKTKPKKKAVKNEK